MKIFNLLMILFLTAISCANPGKEDPPPALDFSALLELKYALEGSVIEPCDYNALSYPCERSGQTTNEDHVILWSGLSCLADKSSFCEIAQAVQDSDGRIWRSPSQVPYLESGTKIFPKLTNSSSRDMYLGFLASLVSTKDCHAAWQSFKYLEANNNKLCDDADDNRCDMHPIQYRAIWGTMKRVWQHIGLGVPPVMDQAAIGDEQILYIQAQTAPIGYEHHLISIQLHIRRAVGHWTPTLQNTADVLLRRNPNNAYFEWLANGPTQHAINLVIAQCPTTRNELRNDWIWSNGKSSMGYDCIFMINTLTDSL